MNIDELTIGDAKRLAVLLGNRPAEQDDSHWQIGKGYFIRTVTHHLTGILRKVTPAELVLSEAAWVADDGRFAPAIAKGEFSEVEPYPADRLVIVGRGSLIDAVEITDIPRSQK